MRSRLAAVASLVLVLVCWTVASSLQPAAAKVGAAARTAAPTTMAAPTTTVAPTTTAAPTTTSTVAPTTTTTAAPTTTTTAAPTTTTTAAAPVAEAAPVTPSVCEAPARRVVPVADSATLKNALAAALPGDRIELADGVYAGQFVIDRSGTVDDRIRLCGSRAAVLRHGVVSTGLGLHLVNASYWDVDGFTIDTVKKGLVLDGGAFNMLSDLDVHNIGEEAIHVRAFSTDNRIAGNVVHDTGLSTYNYGEGVYVGSAVNNWCTYSACGPDRSDRNVVVGNRFANTAAEAIDVKEGTQFGLLEGNTFDGTGLRTRSWVDVKGNNWMVRGNTGVRSPRDGFLTEIAEPGWGTLNTFVGNSADLQGGTGYGFNLPTGNVFGCDNVTTNAALGLANVACSVVPSL